MNVRIVWSFLKRPLIKLDCIFIETLMFKAVSGISEGSQMIRNQAKDAFVASERAAIILSS